MGLLDWLFGRRIRSTKTALPEATDEPPTSRSGGGVSSTELAPPAIRSPDAHGSEAQTGVQSENVAPATIAKERAPAHLVPGLDSYDLHIVGESFHADAFEDLCGPPDGARVQDVIALLVREPTNSYDPNAIAVIVEHLKVGHLSRGDAVRYKDYVEALNARGLQVACKARIRSGWEGHRAYAGSYSVTLDLPLPPAEAFEKWSRTVRAARSPKALENARDRGRREIVDDFLRARLDGIAAEAEVERVLTKVEQLKKSETRRKHLDQAEERLRSWELPEAERARLVSILATARDELVRPRVSARATPGPEAVEPLVARDDPLG